MSYAYTPGLKVTKSTIVRKRRILPIPGEVLVREGESISYDTIVARTYIPGEVMMIPVAHIVGVEPDELPRVIKKKEGEAVKEGEVLAVSSAIFGLFKTEYRSKATGIIEYISNVTGIVAIRENPTPVNIDAYISGKVTEVIKGMGAVIETRATLVQGIFGIGGERQGELMTIADPDETLTMDHIGKDCAGKILVGGSMVSSEVLKKAADERIKGIVVGGINRDDITTFLGYEIGVAITGHENIDLTCIITEGFGNMNMANHTFDLLKSLDGKLASINGATQIRAGVIRPEIVVPLKDVGESVFKEEDLTGGMNIGTRVRIIREPYFGAIGQVASLPAELRTIETESNVRITMVKLDDGRIVTVPRANVEIMEE